MRLYVENIGKIGSATVEINGITIIAGENNTRKSTLGKVLYCVFSGLYDIGKQVSDERGNIIARLFDTVYHNATSRITRRFDTTEMANQITSNSDVYIKDTGKLKSAIGKLYLQGDPNSSRYINDELLDSAADRMVSVLEISDSDVRERVVSRKLQMEFSNQIGNVYLANKPSKIDLAIKNSHIVIEILDNEVSNIE